MRTRSLSYHVKLAAALAAGGMALSLGGCATISHGSTQLVEIASIPAGAEVVIDSTPYGTTPLYAELRRGGRHVVRLSLEGHDPREVRLDRHPHFGSWLVGNVLLLGFFAPVGLGVDAVSGAMYQHSPDPVVAVLTAADAAPDPGGPGRDVAGLAAGDTIRVTTGDAAALFELRAVRGDTLVVRDGDGVVGIPVAAVDRIERGARAGRGGKMLTGAIVGLGFGAVTGAIVGGMFTCAGSQTFFCEQDRNLPLKAAGVLGGAGAVIGLTIGAVSRPGWEWAPVDADRLTVTVAPAAGGARLGMTWRP